MDKTTLVMFPRQAGKDLLSALADPRDDDQPFEVKAAFWIYRPEADDWRLYIASPVVDKLGPLKSYKRVQSALTRVNMPNDDPWNELKLSNISVIGMKHRLLGAVKRIAGANARDVRVRGGSVDDISLDEVYVYCI